MILKKCGVCKTVKNIDSFYSSKTRKGGAIFQCKECSKENREKRKNDNVRFYLIDVIRTSKRTFNSRVNIKNYDIDIDYVEKLFNDQMGLCAISGIKMTHISGKGKVPTNISIDRIDNDEGYVKGNIQLVCHAINMLKFNMNRNELNMFLDQLVSNLTEKKIIV